MPGHKVSIVFTAAAQSGWDDILFFSEARWRSDQARTYEASLTEAIEHIGWFPEIGTRVEYIHPSAQCTGVGVHMLYYTYHQRQITILRILHERRHVSRDLFALE